MKERLPFITAVVLLVAVLLTAEMLLRRRPSAAGALSATPTRSSITSGVSLGFENFPTHVVLAVSPTSIPLQATLAPSGSETPEILATPTLLTISTSTLLPETTPQSVLPSQTPVFFASATAIPFDGSATPPIPLAHAKDGKPQPCYTGPSLSYIETGTFVVARISGYDRSGTWWYLAVYKGDGLEINCWVAEAQVLTAGDLGALSMVEPALARITRVAISAPGPLDANGNYVANIICDDGITSTTLHFSAQIFSTGPLEDVGYRWYTDAPAQFKIEHASITSWNAPAQVTLDLPVPSMAGTYSLRLRTTFPVEAVGGLQVLVQCR